MVRDNIRKILSRGDEGDSTELEEIDYEDVEELARSRGGEQGKNTIEKFKILSNSRRVMVILSLEVTEKEILSLRTLTEIMASLKHGEEYTGKQRKRIYTSLYQNHIEILEEADVLNVTGSGDIMVGAKYDEYLDTIRREIDSIEM